MRRSVEASLKRLDVERIDLLQLHCIPPTVLQKGEVFDWLRKLRQDGLIKEFGASVESIAEGLLCMEQEELFSLQVIFNIFRQKIAPELLPVAKFMGVGIIVRLPLASGLLSGKFTKKQLSRIRTTGITTGMAGSLTWAKPSPASRSKRVSNWQTGSKRSCRRACPWSSWRCAGSSTTMPSR